jgi:uncharacterized protein YndB with AHSA1/START domain
MYTRAVTLPGDTDSVWRAITEPDAVEGWFGARVEWDLRPGGRARFGFGSSGGEVREGVVDDVQPGRSLRFRWWPASGGQVSEIAYELEAGEDGTLLTVTERRIGAVAPAAPSPDSPTSDSSAPDCPVPDCPVPDSPALDSPARNSAPGPTSALYAASRPTAAAGVARPPTPNRGWSIADEAALWLWAGLDRCPTVTAGSPLAAAASPLVAVGCGR